ncbi:MAG TPA: hypothetical protein VMW40_08415 [Candidatus Bathyarchaeia archaeon]|nr:hypothetical protein [Candidatus Bathyarchaeia archaeon]
MSVVIFIKAVEEARAKVSIQKFLERLQIENSGDAISVLEFIIRVEPSSPIGLGELDIVFPYPISDVENVTETFTNPNLYTNKSYTDGFKCLDFVQRKYCIDGIVAFLVSLSSNPVSTQRKDFTKTRLKFKKINPGENLAFRLKMHIPKFAQNYNSSGSFEISVYYEFEAFLPEWRDLGVLGIPIDRRLCEIWVILPEETVFRWAVPEPQQIKTKHKYSILSNNILDHPRNAVYWDLESNVFDLPGREIGDYITPQKGIRLYCETTKPHFIAKYGKLSLLVTLLIGLAGIIIALIF